MHDAYLQPYREAQKSYGESFDVTLWASPESQRLRFAVMTRMADLAGKRVLDAGCSRGDFAAYLLEHGIEYRHFTGLDGLESVIDFATGRGLARSRFVTGDFVHDRSLLATDRPDVVTISGSLNTMDPATATQVLASAWSACGEALIFNFLSDRAGAKAPPQTDPAHRLPTLALFDWALQQTPLVRFGQDYFPHGHDATIAMFKNG